MARSKYQEWLTDDRLLRLAAWARNGLTDEQIAKNMGIASSTLREWKKKYPALSAALKKNKEVVDTEVENALLKRALGYEYDEVTIEVDSNGKQRKKIIKKRVPPDTTAQIFWLKNRNPNGWRDRPKDEKYKAEVNKLKAETANLTGEHENNDALERLDEILKEMRDNAVKQETE